MQIKLNPYLSRALEACGKNVPKLESAMNSAYHDGTTVVDKETTNKLAGTQIKETTGLFRSREINGTVREGKVTDPLRLVHFNRAFTDFCAKQGDPSEEITTAIIPAGIMAWISAKFTLADKPAKKPAKGKETGKDNGPSVPPNRGVTPVNGPAPAAK